MTTRPKTKNTIKATEAAREYLEIKMPTLQPNGIYGATTTVKRQRNGNNVIALQGRHQKKNTHCTNTIITGKWNIERYPQITLDVKIRAVRHTKIKHKHGKNKLQFTLT